MTKIKTSLLFILSALVLSAQETPKQEEIGLVFRNLNSFGVTYRTGTAELLTRFNSTILSGGHIRSEVDSIQNANDRFALDLSIGREYRRPLSDKIDFRIGYDVLLGYGFTRQKRDGNSLNPDYEAFIAEIEMGLNLITGINYRINEEFILGLELQGPGIGYTLSRRSSTFNNNEDQEWSSEIAYGFSNYGVLFSLVYVLP